MKNLMFVVSAVLFSSAPSFADSFILSQWITDFRHLLASQSFTLDQCVSTLESRYTQMYELNWANVDQKDIQNHGSKITEQAFQARLDLQKKVREWEQVQNPLTGECVTHLRNTFRVLRYLEETIAVKVARPAPYDETSVAPYLSGKAPYLQKNPKYKKLSFPDDLKSGDLLVSRGNAPTSALIARLGDVDGQFSHLAMVYVDPKTKQKLVMEAHIEVGSTVRPYAEYANDKNFRVVVYRYKDATIAAAAAKAMVERLYDARNPNVAPYDFNMIMDDDRELFCSEVGYQGFKDGSSGRVLLGKYRTTFNPKNTYLLNQLDVKVKEMFAPSDMEMEPDFELLAEWRDVSRVLENQRMDAVLTQFLAWADDYGYRLDPTLLMEIKTELAYNLRRDRLLSPLVEKKLPLNMTRNAIKIVMALDEVVGTLADFLRAENAMQELEKGVPLTFQQMFESLERYRKEDSLKNHSNFHKLYHP